MLLALVINEPKFYNKGTSRVRLNSPPTYQLRQGGKAMWLTNNYRSKNEKL
tara:strand:+ start:6410 stop:6562 length:153 start_codon:yes stop_codon:yes gene_type:complete